MHINPQLCTRALLRNLVTSLIMEKRLETTPDKARAMRPPRREDGHAWQTWRPRCPPLCWRKGHGADTVFIELLGSEKFIEQTRAKRAEVRSKRQEKLHKQMEEEQQQAAASGETAPDEQK